MSWQRYYTEDCSEANYWPYESPEDETEDCSEIETN